MNLKRIVILAILSCTLDSLACMPFNPIICKDGKPCFWNSTRQGIIGWLDVPAHVIYHKNQLKVIEANRILALNCNGNIEFIHPCDPDAIIPEGLYCWQSDWKDFTRKKETGYRGLHADSILFEKYRVDKKLSMPLRATPISVKYEFNETKNCWGRFDGARGVFTPWDPQKRENELYGPKFPAEQYIQIDANTCESEFYNIMGVTEPYMREFLGANPDQFEHSVIHRNKLKINEPCRKHVYHYFSPKCTHFESRKTLDRCKTINVISLEELKKKMALKKKSPGKISLRNSSEMPISFAQLKKNVPHEIAIHRLTCFDGLEHHLGDHRTLLSDVQLPEHGTPLELHIARKYYHEPVNLLDKLSKKIKIKDGHITKINKSLKYSDLDKIKVAHCSLANKSAYIFTAIPCVEKTIPAIKPEQTDLFLRAAYESAIRTAIISRKSKLVIIPAQAVNYGHKLDHVLDILSSEELLNLMKNSGLEIIIYVPEITEKYKKLFRQERE